MPRDPTYKVSCGRCMLGTSHLLPRVGVGVGGLWLPLGEPVLLVLFLCAKTYPESQAMH